MSTKYIFVTGGVVSSIGKGIVAASLGRLLKNRDLVNERAEYLYPETLANIASKELTALGVEVEVYDEKQCEELMI